MFCSNCGTKNEETAKFCKSCGKALEAVFSSTKETTYDKSETTTGNPGPLVFQFSKSKMIGYLTYLTIKNDVSIDSSDVIIKRKSKPFGVGGKEKVTTLKRSEILNIQVSKKLDVIDGIYVGIFGLLTVFSLIGNFTSDEPNWWITLVLLAVAAISFWTGYGKVIQIQSKVGKPITIPTNGKQNENEFVAAIK